MSTSLEDLKQQAYKLTANLDTLRAIHGKRTGVWSWAQIILSSLTTLLAGITAAGVYSEASAFATVVSILTVISGAAGMAIKPDERREKHRMAADGYGVLHDEVARFTGREVNAVSSDESSLEELWDRFTELQTRFHELGKQTINVAAAFLAQAEESAANGSFAG